MARLSSFKDDYDLLLVPRRTWRVLWASVIALASAVLFVLIVPMATSGPATTVRPTATSQTNPTVAPLANSYPNAETTGARGTLRKVAGPLTLATDGETLENVDVTGRVTIDADNVTLKNVRIMSDDYWALLN